jgi:hypothetical protein
MTDAELTILSLLYEKPSYDHELNKNHRAARHSALDRHRRLFDVLRAG